MKKIYILPIIVFIGIIIVIATKITKFDVIGKESIASFKVITKELENSIILDEENGGWSLTSPDETVRFIWSKDFSGSNYHDVMMEFSSKPFIDAGLDISKLPVEMVIDDMIMVGTMLGDDEFKYDEITPIASYEKIVEASRESIKYHTELDHYGIDLGDGNMFEWAADINTNDKDIVFVLDSAIFIEAGVNPENIEGWVYAKIPTMKDGKKVEVFKLLKPFNIK